MSVPNVRARLGDAISFWKPYPTFVAGQTTRRRANVMHGSPQLGRGRESWSMSAVLARANAETSGPSPSCQRFVAPRTRGASPRRVDSHRGTSHRGVNSPPEDASPSRHARRRVAPPVHEPRSCLSDRRGHGRCSCHTHPLRQNANRGFRATPKGAKSVRDRKTTCETIMVFITASS